MTTPLSSLVDNLSKIYKKECKGYKERKRIKSVRDLTGLENKKLYYKCKECKKRQVKPINGLIKKFPNIYQFCDGYMNSWERFAETLLPDKKKAFYSKSYLENITNEDYTHVQKVFEEFKLKNFGDYHDLYVQSNTVLLADVFENFRNKCIKIYELDPAHILPAP